MFEDIFEPLKKKLEAKGLECILLNNPNSQYLHFLVKIPRAKYSKSYKIMPGMIKDDETSMDAIVNDAIKSLKELNHI